MPILLVQVWYEHKLHRGSAALLLSLRPFVGYSGDANVPSNVTNSPVVDSSKTNDKEETPADTKVKVEDAVVAKAPDGEEVDFKKISVDEALKVLKVCLCQPYAFLRFHTAASLVRHYQWLNLAAIAGQC